MIARLMVAMCALAGLSACTDSMGLEDRIFACGPALPCATGYTCVMDPDLDKFACKKDASAPEEDVRLADSIGTDSESTDTSPKDTNQVDTSWVPDASEMDTPIPLDVEDTSSPDTSVIDDSVADTSDLQDAEPVDTGPPAEPCDPTVDTLCFSPCEGWEILKLPPSPTVPGAMFVDMSGANGQEAFIFSSTGFAVADHQGNIVAETNLQDGLVSARGIPVAADLTRPTTQTLFAKELSLFSAPAQTAATMTWVAGPEPGFKEFVFESTGLPSYDLMRFMAADVDFDGLPELFSGQGCDPVVDIFKVQPWLNPMVAGKLVPWLNLPNGGNSCDYNGGRLLTDLDGDTNFELIVGLGFANAEKTEFWNGDIAVYDIDPASNQLVENDLEEACPSGCFNTDKAPLHKAGVTDLFRQGDIIHAVVRYFAAKTPQVTGSVYYHWQFDTAGNAIGNPTEVTTSTAIIPVKISPEHPTVSVPETRMVGLWDVNNDNFPDRITTSGDDLVLSLFEPNASTFVEHKEARLAIGPTATLRSVGERNGRLAVLVAFEGGAVQCLEMGLGTYNRDGSIPPYEPPAYRTYQKDNYEPNDAQQLPNLNEKTYRIPWLPTNLTGFGKAWSYLESSLDEDYFQVKVVNNSEICVRSPPGNFAYEFSVASTTQPTVSLWDSKNIAAEAKGPHTKCVKPSQVDSLKAKMQTVNPPSNNQIGLFVIHVYTDGPVNADRPYWIDTPGILGWDGFNFGG